MEFAQFDFQGFDPLAVAALFTELTGSGVGS